MQVMKRLFTYLMTHDTGFAPNPFHGTLTLATCKPGIRRTKGRLGNDDWVAGFASQQLVDQSRANGAEIKLYGLIYLMQVGQVMPFDQYFDAPEFQIKKPPYEINKLQNLAADFGDNIYSRNEAGDPKWWPNGNHDISFTPDDTTDLYP